MIGKWIKLINKDVWETPLNTLPKWKAFCYKTLRVLFLTIQGFTKSQIQQGASSLTYYTLLAVVPIMALLLGIARGFALQKPLERWLLQKFDQYASVIKQILTFAEASLEQAHQGLIAGIGVALFFWAAIKILMNVERVMNKVWEVQKGRTFSRRFSDYLALIILCPVIVFLSTGTTFYLSSLISTLQKEGAFFQELSPVLIPLLRLIPYLLTCLLLTFLYIFMPNTHVRFMPALWAGLITGSIYQVVQWVFLFFQVGASKYNAIYGAFAALPLFLIWLHLSWVIILLGAKIAFAIQNANAFGFYKEDRGLSPRFRRMLSVVIAHLVVKQFCEEKPPLSAVEVSNELTIPLPLTGHLLYQLVSSGVLSEVKRDRDKDPGFLPASNVENLTIKRVLDMIDMRGETIPLSQSNEYSRIEKSFEKFGELIEKSRANHLLKEI